jgi:hypothetical protein
MAGGGLRLPYACGRWLPVWLPGIWLATLLFERLRPDTDLYASPASGPVRLSQTVPAVRLAAAGTGAGCRERSAGLELRHSLN